MKQHHQQHHRHQKTSYKKKNSQAFPLENIFLQDKEKSTRINFYLATLNH